MTALADRRRKRTFTMAAVAVVATLAAGLMVYVGAQALSNYEAATRAGETLPIIPIPKTSTALFATVDDDGVLGSVTVFVLARPRADEPAVDRRGGFIISVPVTADSTVGVGDQRISLRQAYADGGDAGLFAAAESALSLTFDFSFVATPDEAAGVLLSVTPIPVNFPAPVTTTVDGETVVLQEAGEGELTAEEAVAVLNSADENSADRFRRANVEAVWAGVATYVDGGQYSVEPPAEADSFDALSQRLFAGPVFTRGLVASTYDDDSNPDDLDVELLDRADVTMVFASVAPSAVSQPLPGLTFHVEAPPGYEAEVRDTLTLLQALGANVILLNLQAAPQGDTVVFVYDQRDLGRAPQSNDVFGELVFGEPDSRVEGIDVKLVLGTRFLDGPKFLETTVPSTDDAGDEPSDAVEATVSTTP